jgi:hypothetical protein
MASVGNKLVEATVPLITIVPGFTPPIVVPAGIVMEVPLAEIVASPMDMLFVPKYKWRNRILLEPKS